VGCTAAGLGNAPLAHWEPGRAPRPVAAGARSDELLLILAFSGGGTRYLDRDRRHFIHLMDGGISDNLGLRGLYERVLVDGGIENTLRDTGNARVRDVVLISVNAQTEPAFRWDLQQVSPSLIEVLDAVTSVQINRYNFETVALLHTAFDQWTQALSTDDRRVRFHFVSVSFDDLRDEGELRYLNELPTSFQLKPDAVDRLRAAARTILRQSPEFQALRQRLARPLDFR
jgi:NTE family protein